MPSNFNFFALPPELRRIVYKHLLEDTHIRLDPEQLLLTDNQDGPKIFRELPLNEMIDFVIPEDRDKITLLRTLAICHWEAITILAQNSTIEVPVKVIGGKIHNVLALIHPYFLKFVPAVQITSDFLLHFRSALLPFLPRVKHRILTGHTRAPYQTTAWTIHDLYCPRCGDVRALNYYDHFWRSFRSGLLKRGWDVDLIVTFDRFREVPGDKNKDFRIRIHYDMAGPQLRGKCLMKGDEVVLLGDDSNHGNMLKALDRVL